MSSLSLFVWDILPEHRDGDFGEATALAETIKQAREKIMHSLNVGSRQVVDIEKYRALRAVLEPLSPEQIKSFEIPDIIVDNLDPSIADSRNMLQRDAERIVRALEGEPEVIAEPYGTILWWNESL